MRPRRSDSRADKTFGAVVFAVDPSEPFVLAARERFPALSAQRAAAEDLPFDDDTFDASLAQLVVHFMASPVAGLREMRRVTRPRGVVAACVWDHAGGTAAVSPFWEVVRQVDRYADDESGSWRPRGPPWRAVPPGGFDEVIEGALEVKVEHSTFEEWWEPYTLGVGPAGAYVARLGEEGRAQLRRLCQERLPEAPFEVRARAWAARALVDAA